MTGRKQRRSATNPCVGIFWLLNGRLLIDKSPLNEAEPYGNHLTHPRSHIKVWEKYQRDGKVPLEMEYEQLPRGRVMFYTATKSFMILADTCILGRRNLISKILRELHLPKNTKTGTDSHYRCFTCLYGTDDDE